jgi:predicted transcriptional regulator
MVKLTFSLDDETVRQLRRLAARTKKPQSLIVREAVARYAAEPEDRRISDAERDRQLAIIRRLRALAAGHPGNADEELRELRESRRGPGRLHPID